MNTANWISLASFVAAAVAAIVAGVSAAAAVLQAKRAKASQASAAQAQAKAELATERATKAAEEAAAWQRQSATADELAADALVEQKRRADEQAEQAQSVPWAIRYREGDLCDLLNITNTSKFGVQVSGPGVAGGFVAFDRIDGRSTVQFLSPRSATNTTTSW